MKLSAAAALFALSASAAPLLGGIDLLDSVLLFDAPAFQTPSSDAWSASQRAFVFLRQPSLAPLTAAFSALLESMGIEVGDQLSTLEERLRLFAAIGLRSQEVAVTAGDCPGGATTVGETDRSGMLEGTIPVCSAVGRGEEQEVKAVLGPLDNRDFSARLFPSPRTGFAVLSDVDDTIKLSQVLDTAETLKKTFLEQPQAIAGMSQLYRALDAALGGDGASLFVYLTGSPFQLQPMLKTFIGTAGFPEGPLLLKNLTLTDVSSLVEFAKGDGTEAYKKAQIEKIHGWYPGKKWLAIGDSTQKDPEVYADA
jgi:phosphatidate phosphatase APP1